MAPLYIAVALSYALDHKQSLPPDGGARHRPRPPLCGPAEVAISALSCEGAGGWAEPSLATSAAPQSPQTRCPTRLSVPHCR